MKLFLGLESFSDLRTSNLKGVPNGSGKQAVNSPSLRV